MEALQSFNLNKSFTDFEADVQSRAELELAKRLQITRERTSDLIVDLPSDKRDVQRPARAACSARPFRRRSTTLGVAWLANRLPSRKPRLRRPRCFARSRPPMRYFAADTLSSMFTTDFSTGVTAATPCG